jgi:hypothetical protein
VTVLPPLFPGIKAICIPPLKGIVSGMAGSVGNVYGTMTILFDQEDVPNEFTDRTETVYVFPFAKS